MLRQLLLAGLGGSIGAMMRMLISTSVNQFSSGGFPYGTLVVNISGSFMLGVVLGAGSTYLAHPYAKAFLATGIIGALTTFSTFSLETLALLESGEPAKAFLNIAISLAAGLAAGLAGLGVGRIF